MTKYKRFGSISFFLLIVLTAVSADAIAGEKNEINTTWRNVAIKGYDTVAYFTKGEPVKGKKEFETVWKGAKWRFSTAQHKDLFAANPQKYAPQYGGY